MENLEQVAIKNLIFLNDNDKFLENKYKLQGKQFISSDNDTFDTIYSCKELEYPLYFTFHQIMNHIHNSYKDSIYGYTRKELLMYMDNGLNVLLDYYENNDTIDKDFEILLDDLDNKIFSMKGYYKYGWCFWAPTKVKEYFNYGCLLAIETSKLIVKDYIEEIKDPGGYIRENDTEENNKNEETSNDSDDDNSQPDDDNSQSDDDNSQSVDNQDKSKND